MTNTATILGRLTKDPEVREINEGMKVANFSVAVERAHKSQDEEKVVDYIPVVAWRALAENIGKYLHKGSMVAVTGSLQSRSYEAQDGSKRFVLEVVAENIDFI